MKKLCNILQKIDGPITIASFILLGIYALGMATPSAATLYYNDTIDFYESIQASNDIVLYFALAGILLGLVYYLLRCHIRKVFYISNFIWIILYTALSVAAATVTIMIVSRYETLYMALPFSEVNAYFTDRGLTFYLNPNTPVFILGYVISGVIYASIIPVILLGICKAVNRFSKKPVLKANQDKEATR